MERSAFWDAATAQPTFISYGAPFHPLQLLATALLDQPIASAVLLALGMFSSLAVLRWYSADPNRRRWAALTLTLAIGLTGDATGGFLFLLVVAVAVVLSGRRRRGVAPVRRGSVAAILIAIALTPYHWMPTIEVRREAVSKRARGLARHTDRFSLVDAVVVEREAARAAARTQNLTPSRRIAVIDHVPEKIRRLSGAALQPTESDVIELDRGVITTTTQTSVDFRTDGWAFLVTNQRWWSGWRVYWNDQRLPPVATNAALVGTFVPPGAGTVTFRYRPDSFDEGLRWAAAGALVFLGAFHWPFFLRAELPFRLRAMRLPKPNRRARVVAATGLVLIAVGGYAAMLMRHRVRVAGGADSSGYLNGARLWSRGQLIVPLRLPQHLGTPRDLDGLFVPLGFHPGRLPRTAVPGYPPGVSLHMAVLRLVGGDDAMFLFSPIAGAAGVVLMYFLGRSLGLGGGWAAAGAVTLAASPLVIYYSLLPLSDVVAMTYSIATMAASFRARRDWRWGLVAGAALGVGVLVRPTQLLLFPSMLLAMRMRPRALLAAAAGALPFAAAQMAISKTLFGSAFRTGYGEIGYLFALENFPPRFIHYSWWLTVLFTPLVFPVAIAGAFLRRIDGWTRASLLAWFLAFFVFYCFYSPYGDWAATRFILPGVPALVALLLLGGRVLTSDVAGLTRRRLVAVALLLVVTSGVFLTRRLNIFGAQETDELYAEAIRISRPYLRGRPLVLAGEFSGAWFYYTGETTLRYDWLTPAIFRTVQELAGRDRRTWYALLSDFEVPNAFSRAPGKWVPITRIRDVTLFEFRE